MDSWLCFCCSITDAQYVRFYSWFIVPPLKKALCQSVGIIGMWDLLTAYDKLIPELKAWQQRPLDSHYPIVWLDAIHYKVKEDGCYVSKAVYTLLALNMKGKKEILGLHLSENEGANYWLSVLTDLNNRGVKDILIACVDGLTGFPEAIASIFPNTETQLCVIH